MSAMADRRLSIAPPDGDQALGAASNLAELIAAAIAASVARLISHEEGVRLGEDPEQAHQFRVATRRLRSDLQTFATALDPDWVTATRQELRWLAGEVGRVRDSDVLGERLRASAAWLPDEDADAVELLLARLRRQAGDAHDALVDALQQPRYEALVDTLVRAARHPPFATEEVDLRLPARSRVEHDVHRQWRRLERTVGHLGKPASDADLHRVRIAAKRCRYAVEAAAPVIGAPAARVADAVADLQTILGDHHDAVVAERWLRDAAADEPATALAAGQLIALQRAEAARLRGRWRRVWRAVRAEQRSAWPQPGRRSAATNGQIR